MATPNKPVTTADPKTKQNPKPTRKLVIPGTNAATTNPLRAAKPTRIIFDPWNNVSKGHQHAENKASGSTGWRDMRTVKLAGQLGDVEGRGGGEIENVFFDRIFELDGEDGKDGPGGKMEKGTAVTVGTDKGKEMERLQVGWRQGGRRHEAANGLCRDPDADGGVDGVESPRKRRKVVLASGEAKTEDDDASEDEGYHMEEEDQMTTSNETRTNEGKPHHTTQPPAITNTNKQIFRNLTFYINGSTAPLISDHKLKQQLVLHGGTLAISLQRRKVTHVILGTPNASSISSSSSAAKTGTSGSVGASSARTAIHNNSSSSSKDCSSNDGRARQHAFATRGAGALGGKGAGGAGGGLASSKIQKEIAATRGGGGGVGVKFVGVEWVLACLARGARVAEAAYAVPGVAVAGSGQRSVREMMMMTTTGGGG